MQANIVRSTANQHLKFARFNESVPRTAFKEVGSGTLDWPGILEAASESGVKQYFVEQDQTPGDPIESLRESFAYLSK